MAAEPDLSSRQLQEKAGGVMPAGLFSCRKAMLWMMKVPPTITAL
jgi:hypothetical protein